MTSRSKVRRILMTADTIGGVWTYALELAEGLRRLDVEIIFATMGGPLSASQKAQVSRLDNIHLSESAYRLEWMEDPWDDVHQAGLWLQALESRYEPDLIHLNGFAHAALPWMSPVISVGHSCVLSWFEAVKGHGAPQSWRHYRNEVRRGLQAADHVVAPTRAMMRELERHYGPPARRQVIPNGRDQALFKPGPKERLILSAGRLWDEAKNVSLLCRVAPSLPWPVHVAGCATGPGSAPVDLPNVHCLGRLEQEELAGLYARAAIYALPARYEPFGLSALEAGLAGCALVLGDIASLREVWRDAALFVPADDDNAWRDALHGLSADPARVAALGAAARERASTFSTSRFASAYYDLYARVLDPSRRSLREPVIAA